jgi:NADH:ubiquinone oxidoreductase subunit E
MNKEKTLAQTDLARIETIIAEYHNQRWALLPLLERIQQEFGFIPKSSIDLIAKGVGLFPSQVQGVITFYAGLYTTPRGRNIVRVCRGTACHVRGGKTILKLVKRHLDIDEGEITPDLEYSLETVACIGCCALAPNVVINKNIYGRMNPKKVASVFGHYGSQ